MVIYASNPIIKKLNNIFIGLRGYSIVNNTNLNKNSYFNNYLLKVETITNYYWDLNKIEG
jgi:hypothetical protein